MKDVLGGLKSRYDSKLTEMRELVARVESTNNPWSPSDERSFNELENDVEQISARINDIETAEARRAATEADPGYQEYHRLNNGGERSRTSNGGPAIPTRSEYRALSEGTGSAGGFLVPPQQANEMLSYLRKRNAFLAAGPRIIPMNTDEFVYPRIATSATIAQYAENALITASDPTFGSVTLRPKASAGLVLISRQLWDDSTPISVREAVMQDFLATMSEHLENQFLRGDGTGSNLTGIRFQTGVTVTSLGANGLGIEIDQILDALGRLRASKAGAKPVVFVSQRSVNSLLKKKSTANEYLFGLSDTTLSIGGAPLVITDAIPDNITHGTSTVASELIIADMSEVLVGENQSPEIAMSEHAYFASLQIATRIWARYDVQLANAAGVEIVTGVLA